MYADYRQKIYLGVAAFGPHFSQVLYTICDNKAFF